MARAAKKTKRSSLTEREKKLIAGIRRKSLEYALDDLKTGKEDAKSRKALKLASLVSNIGGCKKRELKDLVEEITGISLPDLDRVTRGKEPFVPLLPIVPTRNENSHNYPLNKVVIVKDSADKHCFQPKTGMTGNHMGNYYRVATKMETERYYDELTDAGAKKILASILVVEI